MIEQSALVRERVKRYGLHEFTRQFWHLADPAQPFIDGWHLGAVCEHLEAVTAGQIRRLVINMPPGHTKSISASVMWPSWNWVLDPSDSLMRISYDINLVYRDAQRSIEICTSDLFTQAWPSLKLDVNQPIGNFTTEAGGRQFSTSPGSKGTGWHTRKQLGDDLLKPKDATSRTKTALEEIWALWTQTYANRSTDAAQFARVLMMQRIHDMDPAGRALKELGYEHLCLPLEYVPGCSWDRGSSLHFKDPRTEPGEILCPARHTSATIAELKKEMGTPSAVAAQLQQNPTPDKGGYVERAWLQQRYREYPAGKDRLRWRQYWDLGSKGRKEAAHSRVHGLLCFSWRGQLYLVDERSGHWNYPQTKAQFLNAQSLDLWRGAGVVWIEDKANGSPLLDDLKADPEVPAGVKHKIKGWNPGTLSKEERFAIESDKVEGGLVVLPHGAAWVDEWIDEIVAFPNGAQDDRCDTLAMALKDLADASARYREALAAAAKET